MRVWLIGAGEPGKQALRQLQKSEEWSVVVSAATDRPAAVRDGIIAKVDHIETVTALNINQLARRIRPDLILMDASAMRETVGRVTGGTTFSQSMMEEMAAASDYPCLIIGT
jgi:FlaA1/EpsC-like NDP-sugar epimerase